jgi:hypothetical protein
MSTKERDQQIFEIVSNTFKFQFELGERLDDKLNNFIAIIAVISTKKKESGFTCITLAAYPNRNLFS